MDEKKCKYCAMMIPKDAKICPHCRKTQGWTLPAKIFVGLLLFGAIMSVVAERTDKSKPLTQQPSKQIEAQKEDLELIDWKWEVGEYGNIFIVGTVKNNTNKSYRYVQISL